MYNIEYEQITPPISAFKSRDSNLELLRIVAMSMILIHHFLLFVITPEYDLRVYTLFNPFFYCGVNLFFLISGWFGIKLSVKGLVKIIGLVLLFTLLNYGLMCLVGQEVTSKNIIKTLLFPISSCNYWFMRVYVFLMLVSPLVNQGLNAFDLKRLRLFILAFSAFTFYSCGIGHNSTNLDGYNFVNALYLYCLAHYLRRDEFIRGKLSKKTCIVGYFLIIMFCSLAFTYYFGVCNYIGYNSVFMITASMLLFLFFTKLEFQSQIVNFVSTSALGCYLLQEGMWGHSFCYPYLSSFYVSWPLSQSLVLFTGVFLAIWISSMILTKPFAYITKRAAVLVDNYLSDIRYRLKI
jgi:hypothetical protein